jgi:hypothetical protein
MKSIFQKAIFKKYYYLTNENYYVPFLDNKKRYYPKKLPENGEPAVYVSENFIEYIEVFETDKFTNIFNKNDKVCINNEIYSIFEVIYGIDTYIYRIYEYELIDDEESKNKAMKDYNNKINEIKKQNMIQKEKNKKWWQFWK